MGLIPLTQGQFAKVDDEDFAWLSQWNWRAHYSPCSKSFYAMRSAPSSEGGAAIYMHRLILGAQKGQQVDHESHDTLDNRRENMRLTTHQGNGMNRRLQKNNTSGHCGVHWHALTKKWRADIKVNGKFVYLGLYADKSDAAAARLAANVKYGFHENHGLKFKKEDAHDSTLPQ